MPDAPSDLRAASALVVDGNSLSRSIIVAQLRSFGIGTVGQCSRLREARNRLEISSFDVVICEHDFENESISGQDLLDDLRRNQLLPFYTVFVMMTSNATYAKVAEAAESALDAYVVKPHTAMSLETRIQHARRRKHALKSIFTAIDNEDFETATDLCKDHFDSRKDYWLYAARIGAELMLRVGRLTEAQTLYEAVVAAKTLPWARLGVARAQLEGGQINNATQTLTSIIQNDPGFSDAYDVMGRAQFEQGDFNGALATFKMATQLTPSSVNRLLKHGMMAFYKGDRNEGVEMLERATRIGLESKLFDPQALVLLAFFRLEKDDAKGMTQCQVQLARLYERSPQSERIPRLMEVLSALVNLRSRHTARALDDIRHIMKSIREPGFDFEAASNLLALMTQLANHSIQLTEMDAAVDVLGLRFCTSRAMTELLASAAIGNTEHAEKIQQAHTQVLKITQEAMSASLKGNPQRAVESLLDSGAETLNAKIIESAHLVLQRYEDRIPEHEALRVRAQELRERYRTGAIRSGLGDQANTGRAAGGVSIPSRYQPKRQDGLLAKVQAA
jgi:CheY-like chemotaxis protein/Tfp pilus assembly protein PilF